MYFGVEYHPEHWVYPFAGSAEAPESRWGRDIELMAAAGVNVVRMGEFAWGLYEPEERKFDFDWMRRAMDLFGQAGIKVVLATPTAAPPVWLAKKHPEILPLDERGLALHEGTRRACCMNSDVYWHHSRQIVTALAQALGQHPQLIAWQIDNGLGGHHTEASFHEETRRNWHAWLKAKDETVERLNDLLGLNFWALRVTRFDDVPMPMAAPAPHNPALVIDWMRFSSDTLLAYVKMQADLLYELSPGRPVTNNLRALSRDLDHLDLAAALDFVSMDSNAAIHSKSAELSCDIDMMRSLKKTGVKIPGDEGGFWCIEQKAGHVNWADVNSLVRPGIVRLLTYQLVSRGAGGVLYFLWRQPRISPEKFYGGVLSHDGRGQNRVYQEISLIGRELQLPDSVLHGTRVVSEVCILFSHENESNSRCVRQPNKFFNQREHLQLFYNALHDRNIPVDFARPTEDLSQYKLVSTCNTGLIDEHHLASDTGYPHDLTDLFGLEVVEFDPLPPGEENHLTIKSQFPVSHLHPARLWWDLIEPKGCQVLGIYAKDFYAGQPAITMNSHGQGHLHRHGQPAKFLFRPGPVAAPVVQLPFAAQGARQRRSQPPAEGRPEDLFPAQPPKLLRAHHLLQGDARFSDRPDLHRQPRSPAARRARARRVFGPVNNPPCIHHSAFLDRFFPLTEFRRSSTTGSKP